MQKLQESMSETLTQAHNALLEDMADLEKAVRSTEADGLARLQTRLSAARVHILEHFRFEEQNGYMDKVKKREPRLERNIDQLAEEHRQMAQSLDAIILQAKAAVCMDNSLREKIDAWIACLRDHETRENRLVQEAFNFEVSAED